MDLFIENVRLYPLLWDTGNISYRDTSKKELVWKHIAQECGMANGKEAQCQWKKLRDSHREAMRRRKMSIGQSWKPWKYEAEMEFILPQSAKRANFSTFSNDSQDSYNLDTSNTTDMTIKQSPPSFSESPPSPSESPVSTPYSIKSENMHQNALVTVPSPYSIKSENMHQNTLVTESVTEILQEREHRQYQRDELRRKVDMKSTPQDALSKLFDSLCQKTRELPKHLQLRVEREIFEAVSRAEEEALSLAEQKP